MTVTKEKATPEEKASEQKELKSKSDDLVDGILKTIDLPEGEEEAPEENEPEGEEETEDEEGAEEQEDDEGEEEDEEDEDEEDNENEEVVPKSKVDKIQKKFERRLAAQQAQIRQLEAKANTNKNVDSDQAKLDAMDTKSLKTLKRQVRVAQLKAQDDETRLEELLDLEEKIDNTLSDAPQKLLVKQTELYDQRAAEIMEDEENLSDEAVKFIKEKAAQIYKSDKVYQRSENGQKLALDLAYEHFVEIRKAAKKSTKSGNTGLKRKLNTLKKKTRLTSPSQTGKKTSKALKRLRDKAKEGTAQDKENFILNDPAFQIDSMIPEDML